MFSDHKKQSKKKKDIIYTNTNGTSMSFDA